MNAAKLQSALGVVRDERRPLIWTDDEQIPTSGPDLAALTAEGQRVLLIAPASTRGLRPEHAEQIRHLLVTSSRVVYGPGERVAA